MDGRTDGQKPDQCFTLFVMNTASELSKLRHEILAAEHTQKGNRRCQTLPLPRSDAVRWRVSLSTRRCVTSVQTVLPLLSYFEYTLFCVAHAYNRYAQT